MRTLLLILSLTLVASYTQAQAYRAAYHYSQEKTNFEASYTLLFNDNLAYYQHNQPYKETQNEEVYKFYFHQDNYNWFYSQATGSVKEFKILENDIPLTATYQAGLEWQFTGETKTI